MVAGYQGQYRLRSRWSSTSRWPGRPIISPPPHPPRSCTRWRLGVRAVADSVASATSMCSSFHYLRTYNNDPTDNSKSSVIPDTQHSNNDFLIFVLIFTFKNFFGMLNVNVSDKVILVALLFGAVNMLSIMLVFL